MKLALELLYLFIDHVKLTLQAGAAEGGPAFDLNEPVFLYVFNSDIVRLATARAWHCYLLGLPGHNITIVSLII